MEEDFKFIPYEEQKRIAEENRVFLRKGYCSRCGLCCWNFKGRPSIKNRTEKCKHLEYDENGLASCNIYNNRHESCIDFPIYPFSMHDRKYFKDCTYTWELDMSLSKEEALKRQNRICESCYNKNKEECKNRIEITELIKEKLL